MGAFNPGNFASGPGSSSYGASLPQLPPPPVMAPSGSTPSSTPPGGGSYTGGGTATSFQNLPNTNNQMVSPFLDPTLTNQLLSFLGGNLGKGLPAFNQQVSLPSGGQTQPGALSAPLNPILQSLQQFMTGAGGPGSLPGVLPMWQSEMSAMQAPIQQNLTDLKEQFGSMGALGSSELGTASMDYLSQTSADEMALLTSATQSSLPNMLSAGMGIQGVDQSAITSAYNQFQTDLPQNNPLLPATMGLGTMQPGTTKTQPSFLQGLVDSLMSNAGGIAQTAGSAANAAMPNAPGWASILMGV